MSFSDKFDSIYDSWEKFNVRLANLSSSAAVSVWYSVLSKDKDFEPDNSPESHN